MAVKIAPVRIYTQKGKEGAAALLLRFFFERFVFVLKGGVAAAE